MPLGEVLDFFFRVEFQKRGSPHIHVLFWIKDAPEYGHQSDETIVKFVDKFVSCSHIMEHDDSTDLINLQTHRHAKTCNKQNQNVCRFHFPLPPLPKTMILKPLSKSDVTSHDLTIIESNAENIKTLLSEMKYGEDISFQNYFNFWICQRLYLGC